MTDLSDFLFWAIAALLTAACCAVVVVRAARSARTTSPEDPALAVHRRQLGEIDALAARGLLSAGEVERARTEAARRLLRAGERRNPPARPETAWTRIVTLIAVAAGPLLALALYVALGSPGTSDQPRAERVRAWRTTDPGALSPAQMGAVLEHVVRERPGDFDAWLYLGRARLAAGDAFGGLRAFQTAVRLRPAAAPGWEGLGEAFTAAAQGRVSDDARRAFEEALRRDPRSAAARYQLARVREANGDRAGAVENWRALAAELSPNDPRRIFLEGEIARVEGGAVVRAGAADPAVEAMVAGLAERLEHAPNDPAGWARLVRSYRVLGRSEAAAAALARARTLFRQRPDALAVVEREAGAPS